MLAARSQPMNKFSILKQFYDYVLNLRSSIINRIRKWYFQVYPAFRRGDISTNNLRKPSSKRCILAYLSYCRRSYYILQSRYRKFSANTILLLDANSISNLQRENIYTRKKKMTWLKKVTRPIRSVLGRVLTDTLIRSAASLGLRISHACFSYFVYF